jgi:hypothetical protein
VRRVQIPFPSSFNGRSDLSLAYRARKASAVSGDFLLNAASLRAFRTGKLPRKWLSGSEHGGKIFLQLKPSGENRRALSMVAMLGATSSVPQPPCNRFGFLNHPWS